MSKREELKISALYSYPEHSVASPFLARFEYPWEALASISEFILELGASLPATEYDRVGENVWIAKTATVAPTASVNGPCIICDGAEVRHCAFIRGSAIVGAGVYISYLIFS